VVQNFNKPLNFILINFKFSETRRSVNRVDSQESLHISEIITILAVSRRSGRPDLKTPYLQNVCTGLPLPDCESLQWTTRN